MNTLDWFKQALPNPTAVNFTVQLGCHLEELVETLEALQFTDDARYAVHSEGAITNIRQFAEALKAGKSSVAGVKDVPELIDGLADQHVTLTGLAHIAGLDFEGAKSEVDRSNFSKFVDGKPVFNTNGKIAKGPDYMPPDLDSFVPAVQEQVGRLFD